MKVLILAFILRETNRSDFTNVVIAKKLLSLMKKILTSVLKFSTESVVVKSVMPYCRL